MAARRSRRISKMSPFELQDYIDSIDGLWGTFMNSWNHEYVLFERHCARELMQHMGGDWLATRQNVSSHPNAPSYADAMDATYSTALDFYERL